MINGAPVGFAGGVSGSESVEYAAVDVLNLLEVREHVPVAYRVSMNAQIFRVVGSSLKAQGIMPRLEDVITADDLEAALQDSVTANTVQLFQGVRCAGQNFDVSARGVVSLGVDFVAIRTLDESENPV
jgi:hypothetical protein